MCKENKNNNFFSTSLLLLHHYVEYREFYLSSSTCMCRGTLHNGGGLSREGRNHLIIYHPFRRNISILWNFDCCVGTGKVAHRSFCCRCSFSAELGQFLLSFLCVILKVTCSRMKMYHNNGTTIKYYHFIVSFLYVLYLVFYLDIKYIYITSRSYFNDKMYYQLMPVMFE